MKSNIKKTHLKLLDYIILIIALIAVFFLLRYTFTDRVFGSSLIATSLEGEWLYDLHTDQSFGINGPLGMSIITLQNGTAFFHSSPCDNQICVMAHPISLNNGFIACLPNQVFIRIKSQDSTQQTNTAEGLDSIGY